MGRTQPAGPTAAAGRVVGGVPANPGPALSPLAQRGEGRRQLVTICWRGDRTSRTSRNPSPTSCNASTVSASASPGQTTTCGATRRNGRPSSIMAPHEARGGGAPSPREDKPDSGTNAPPLPEG